MSQAILDTYSNALRETALLSLPNDNTSHIFIRKAERVL